MKNNTADIFEEFVFLVGWPWQALALQKNIAEVLFHLLTFYYYKTSNHALYI